MDPFDLPGPQFLVMYVGLAVTAFVLAYGLRSSLRGPADDLPEDPQLHPYEAAHLVGGATQTVNTAVASLIEAEAVTFDSLTHELTPTGTLPAAPHPLEMAILDALPNTFRVTDARAAAAGEVGRIRARLEEQGLELTSGQASRASLFPSLLIVAVGVFGLVKVFVGISRGKPVEVLEMGVLFILFVAVITFLKRSHRTHRGDRLLHKLRSRHAALHTTASTAATALRGNDLTMAVGLFGVGIIAIGRFLGLDYALTPSNGWWGSGYGGWGSGWGSGCSGASCCSGGTCGGGGCGGGGGGCGGCGGGGN